MINRPKLILMCYAFILQANLKRRMNEKDWINTLVYAHDNGYLWVDFTDNLLSRVGIAYRVEDLEKARGVRMPSKEMGDKLFVPFFINARTDRKDMLEVISGFFQQYKDLNQIGFETKAKKLKIFDRPQKEGIYHGRRKKNLSGSTAVPV